MQYDPDALDLLTNKINHAYVGYSGGIDSTVLLHSLKRLQGSFTITALHINHNLHPQANEWQQHCQKFCNSLEIDIEIHSIQLPQQNRRGTEDLARQAREKVFLEMMGQGNDNEIAIVLGHHQADQIENFFIRLFRGAGIRGLASMSAVSKIKQGAYKIRPMINCKKQDIVAYAHLNNLSWVEDHSNQDQTYTRNWLRHKILPSLKQKYPQIEHNIARTIEIMQDSQLLLEEVAKADLKSTDSGTEIFTDDKKSSNIYWLETKNLTKLGKQRCCNLLRFWLKDKCNYPPSKKQLDRIYQQFFNSNSHKSGVVDLGKYHVIDKHNHRIRLKASD